MKNPRIIALLLLTLTCIETYSQNDYVLEVTAGKKTLNTGNLKLMNTTPAIELLAMFPELLSRGNKVAIDNYDVQINDVSISNKLQVLKQYTLAEIANIEVSTNPSTSQQKDGQSGLIKIKLKELSDGISGNAAIYLNSFFSVHPGVTVNYKKGHWSLRSSLAFEYDHPETDVSTKEVYYPNEATYQTDSTDTRKTSHLLNVKALYKKGGTNIDLWAMERTGHIKNDVNTEVELNSIMQHQMNRENEKNFEYLAGAKITQKFDNFDLKGEITVTGSPSGCYSMYKHDTDSPKQIKFWSYDETGSSTTATGLVELKHHFAPKKSGRTNDLSFGVNCSNKPEYLDYEFSHIPGNKVEPESPVYPQQQTLHSRVNLLYLSPYIESNNVFDNWYLKAGLRYQHYKASVNLEGMNGWSRPENYFTAFMNIGVQMAPHHHLSMIIDRSVNRMQPYQLYPFSIYSPTMQCFSTGNPNLQPVSVHNVSLNYITDFKVNGNYFTFDTEVKYINADNLIKTEKDGANAHYSNDGNNNIFVANLFFLYSQEVLTLTLTANYFNNRKMVGGEPDKYNYFNVSLAPVLNFGKGWAASLTFTYNSHIYTGTSRQSDYLFTLTRFSKSWNNMTAYLEMSDNFHKNAIDEYFSSALSERKLYNISHPSIELGFHIKF